MDMIIETIMSDVYLLGWHGKDDPDLERYTRDCKDDESGKSFLKFFKPGVMEPVKRKADANIETDNFS